MEQCGRSDDAHELNESLEQALEHEHVLWNRDDFGLNGHPNKPTTANFEDVSADGVFCWDLVHQDFPAVQPLRSKTHERS